MKRYFSILLFVGLLTAVVLAGCQSVTGRSAMQTVDDAKITSVINGKLFQEPGLSAIKIDVDSFQGNVTLTGAVPTKDLEQRAVEIAKQTEGVKSVKSNLIVAGTAKK